MSAGSAPHIFSVEGAWNFLKLHFLIIGLCNSSANSLLDVFSFLILLPEMFY